MGDPSDQSPVVLEKKFAIVSHWLLAFLLGAAFLLEIVSFFWPLNFQRQFDGALLLIAAISTLASLCRQLPLQNVLLAVFGIAVIGEGLSAAGAKTGLPFGPFIFSSGIGPVAFKSLSWVMPLLWIIIVFNSRGTARLILRPWRKNKNYGYRLMGLTAVLVLLFDVAFEPFATQIKHLWFWTPTMLKLTWQTAPLVNFFVWACATLLILLFVTPALIVKKPRPKRGADFYPFGVWLGALVIFGAGCAASGIWAPVFVDGAIAIGAAIFSIRGAMW
jgi:uncharacterized membrane protein